MRTVIKIAKQDYRVIGGFILVTNKICSDYINPNYTENLKHTELYDIITTYSSRSYDLELLFNEPLLTGGVYDNSCDHIGRLFVSKYGVSGLSSLLNVAKLNKLLNEKIHIEHTDPELLQETINNLSIAKTSLRKLLRKFYKSGTSRDYYEMLGFMVNAMGYEYNNFKYMKPDR